tara:strand:+ start:4576 stop:4884 length:309 start_codon:yes stop_codon:yes gene_type:complete
MKSKFDTAVSKILGEVQGPATRMPDGPGGEPKKPRLDEDPPPSPDGMITTPPPPTEPAGGAFDTATKWVAKNKPLAAGLGGAAAALLAAKLLKKKEEKERRR